jgi:secreted PhoX family phosphatase
VLQEQRAEAGIGRRVFIKGLAATGALVGGLAVAPGASAQEGRVAAARAGGRRPAPFSQGWTSQPGRFFDDVSLPDGFTYDVVASYRDPIGGGESFGYNNDFIAYFPLAGRGDRDGLLWVNHEYPDAFFIHGNPDPATKTAAQIELEQYAVGGAVIRVQRQGHDPWTLRRDRRYARRITATSPRIRMTGAGVGDPGDPAWAPVPEWTDGSLANCAGGITPWATALSAEENWADYATVYGWGPDFAAANNGGYGWVMEVDPADPDWTPRKHTNLGRLRHENATVWAREGKQLVVYTGDDARNKFLYKYVSAGAYHKARGRRNSRLLEDGQLWVAEFAPASQDETVLSGTGRWHQVEMSPAALVDPDTWVRAQSWFNPATFPLNRPEDAELDPYDNSLYTALTNNTDDPHGRIRRLAEEGRDPTADTFAWSDIAVGGPDPGQVRGFSSPDNLVFDRLGNLWMVTDISSSALNDPASPYAYHRNNGIFMIRVGGPDAGVAFRFGSVPNESESTGPIWSPDQTTMFLAIQHPGEETSVSGGVHGDPTTYTSWWPRGNKTTGENPSEPLPSVIAIRRA